MLSESYTLSKIPKTSRYKVYSIDEEEDDLYYGKADKTPYTSRFSSLVTRPMTTKFRNLIGKNSSTPSKHSTFSSGELTERKILNELNQEHKLNEKKMQMLKNRINSLKKQQEDYMRIFNRIQNRNNKEQKRKELKEEIKRHVTKARLEKEMDDELLHKKVQEVKNEISEKKKKMEMKKKEKIAKLQKTTLVEKNLNLLIKRELSQHILNLNHSKKTKVDTEILQKKIKNMNKSLEKKESQKNKLKMQIVEKYESNNRMKSDINELEKIELDHVGLLKETITKKNILRKHFYYSVDLTNNNYLTLTQCNTGRSLREKK